MATIKGRILTAFLAMSVITAALGGYAAVEVDRAGQLVQETFDKSLMSVNYARAAAADFAAMQAAVARRWASSDLHEQEALDTKIQSLARSLEEDLAIATERSQSERAARAAARAREAVEAWQEARLRQDGSGGQQLAWQALDSYVASATSQIELLVNLTAGDGFIYRQRAKAIVAADRWLNLAATAAAVMLSAVVVSLLVPRITRPVAAASAAAERIAAGDLDGPVPKGGADELGALLVAMGVMRDNIKAMMADEVAQHRSAQARLADALQSSREGVVVVDADGRIVMANKRAGEFLGGVEAALRNGTSFVVAAPAVAQAALAGGSASEVQLADGRWLRVSRSATRDGGFVVVCTDVTALRDKSEKLEASNLWLDAALGNIAQGLCLYDADSRLQVVNARFCEIFRLPPGQVVPGLSLQDVLELAVAAGSYGERSAAQVLAEETGVHARTLHAPGLYPVGSAQFQELSEGRIVAVTRQTLADGGWVATYEDVTERRRAEAQIAFLASHDALTGLPNRLLFAERLDQALAQAARHDEKSAVLLLDLDRFKAVNDTLGHPVGDELLVMVADRLQACVRDVDTVARLGGDEFAVIQCGLEQGQGVTMLARRIVEVISEPYELQGQHVVVGASIGISMAPEDGGTCQKLLKNADVALYKAKADGRGTWRFFDRELDAQLQTRRTMEIDLRAALSNDELELYYQPLFDLREDRIGAFEALLRWHHPTQGMVPPADFISVSEEIGLIVPIGEWVLRRACLQASSWPNHVRVAVNVSPAQFKTGRLLQCVSEALAASGLRAGRLELEITESVLLADSATTLATLHAIRSLGVRISMDDFGTGYSSLSYLRSFPFDKIKIDQSFIRDLGTTDGANSIVRVITGLGNSLSIKTTAEGVETIEQLSWLRSEGCSEAQGYLFSPPMSAEHVPGLLARWSGAALVA